MAKKQKFLKNLLTSVSVASVIASMGWNNVAFGTVATTHGFRMLSKKDITLSDTADKKNWKKVQKNGNPVGDYTSAPGDNTAFLYSGPVTLDANVHDRIITAINLVSNKPGMLTVNENLSIGSIVRGERAQKNNIKNVLPIAIAAGKTLTLTGTKAIDTKHGFTTRENTYTALGNIILNGADSTLVIRPANDDAGNPGNISLTGNITTNIDREGILTFEGSATVTGEIGANNALAEVNFNEVGNIHLRAVAKAETFKFGAEAIVNAHTNIIGNVDFNGNNAATINLAVGQKIDGAVDNTGIVNNGILNFAGIGTVTGKIGANNALLFININDGDVDLQQDVSTETLHFAVANRTVKIGGNFTGKVDFANAGTLTFYDANSHSFNAIIANGDNGTLNVQTKLVATRADIGSIKTINIGIPGEVGPPVVDSTAKVLAINVSDNNVHLLTPADAEVNFLHPESRLELFTIGQDRIITFENNLPGHAAVDGGGIVFMCGINDATLAVQANGNKSLGTAARKLGHIAAFGKVTIKGDNANKVDISNTGKLSIVHDTKFVTEFIDESGTSAAIARIDIGRSYTGAGGVGTAVTGPATYVLDAKHGDFHILTDATHRINFLDPDAKLILRNSNNDDKTITLANNLVPINDKEGVVEFNSPIANTMLTINKVGDASLGTANLKLKEIIFSGAGNFDIKPTLHVKDITLDVDKLTLNDVNSDITFAQNTVFTANGNITGGVDFNGKEGTVMLADNKKIDGAVDNTGIANNGILNFAGIGTVTGNIGKNNALLFININDGDVDLQQDVSTETLHFAVANRTVKIGGNFTGEVYFANAGTLTFYGADPHSFNATIANGDNGILNVQTDLIATHEDIGNIKTINIGIPGEVGFPVVDPVAKVLAINASVNNINLLTPADAEVNFLHPESRLELFTIRQDRIITFKNDLPGHAVVGGGGIVFMSGINDATLTVQANGNKSLGTVARKLGHIAAFGKVTIKGDNANKVDISNTGKLSIVHDTKFVTEFIDESGTSAAIARIDIGQSYAGAGGVGTAVTGPATYVLDAKHGDFHILTDATHRINFLDPDAKLILRNSDNDNKTITLANNLVPINDKEGVVEFNSPVVNTMLTINKVGDASLGTANLKLKEIIFSGAGDLNITPTIYAHTIISDITGTVTTNGIHGDVLLSAASQLTGAVNGSVGFAATAQLIGNVTTDVLFNANGKLVGNVGGNVVFASAGTTTGTVAGHVVIRDGGDGTVGGLISNNVTFNGDGQLTANGSIQGDVYFDHKKGTVTLADKQKIGGIIKDGENATLEFLGDGEVGGAIDGLKLLTAGNGNVTLAASGNHSVTEIQGNGVQKLTLASGFNLAGGINLTGGQAVGLIFEGNSRISGVVGTEKNPVGNIQIKAGTVRFDDLINAKNIRILGGTTVEITKDVNAENINGLGIVKFNNKKDIVINSKIGANIIEIAGSNVETIQTFSAVNVHFSSSQNATLTLKEDSIISNITTAGNGLHSLALNANLTIVGDVGSDSNRLKEIKLLGDHTLSITNSNLYAAVLTTTSDSSKVIFESSGSVAYGNLGSDKFRLSDVTFDSDSTVKADIYSKKITIKDNKTATFAGTEERALLISGIPRLLKDFTYSTEIVSEEINVETASSKMKFGNATLVKAPIKDGQVILADNVWFKEEVMSTTPVTFVPGKYVILEKNIAFSSIEASQAKLIILAEKQTITGDLTAKDLTIDLGTSQLKYAGNAKLVGELKLHSFYDSSKSAGGNIEIQSNGKLDLSQLDKLLVTIAGRTDVNKISDDTKYILISSVYGNGISTLDPSKITLDSTSEQNRFVSWTINPNNLTLYAKDISKEVLEKEFADKPKEKKQFIKQLDKAAEADINCDAAKFRNDLGCMDKNNAQLAMEKLLSSNENLTSMKDGLESLKYVISEVIFQVTHQITLRSENMQVPVASGDDDNVILYGIWGSPFYSIADQKMRKGVSGYKSKSAGGIVGFDSLINDNLLIGTAYSQINTKMFHKDQKIGDKTSGNTNVFSIYGLYKFSANWFAEAIASYGITNVKNLEGRVLPTDKRTVTTLGIAVAKYKSTSYSGQLLTGYSYQLSEKLTITPIIGLRYSQFIDAGHVETGTACQNLIVKNRLYNKFEGILGLRTATNIQLDQLLLIPELHGYINYEFKGKSPIIEARLGGMNEPLQTKSVKSAKIFFTVGTSLAAKHNMMEYSVAYNANIANKYIGHQGSLKVKVNF